MPLFILTETSVGYVLLKSKDKKLLQPGKLGPDVDSEQITSLLKLKQFQKFDSAAAALEEVAALVEGKVTPKLASLLDSIKDEAKASLAVADPKLASAIKKLPQLSITPISDSTTADLYRSIREHLPSLLPGLLPNDLSNMSLGLSHSLSRHKLKFSPDKVDTMVVQAIALLDDLDKELNIYAMRVKEWYGWHFPEMAKIINDNLAYARVILEMGMRTSASSADLAEILPEEIEAAVKAAAEVSMGTEITAEDLDNIQNLARQVVDFTDYRQQLSSYLSARMTAIAPNLTQLVGDLVGARLIAHAGSLMNLAKSAASTIQILGAEKALFRALKTKHDTPKYGLIFHASLVGQATGRNKAKIARVLAAKSAIGVRVDALEEWGIEGEDPEHEPSEEQKAELGREARHKIERQLAKLEGKPIRARGVAIGPNGVSTQPGKWEVKEARKYNKDADGLVGDEPAAAAPPKIQDVTVKPAVSKEVEMANGDDNEDEGDKMEEDDSEGEDLTVPPSNGAAESGSEAEDIPEETPEEKRRREKKERKRLKKEDEAKPETKEERAARKELKLHKREVKQMRREEKAEEKLRKKKERKEKKAEKSSSKKRKRDNEGDVAVEKAEKKRKKKEKKAESA